MTTLNFKTATLNLMAIGIFLAAGNMSYADPTLIAGISEPALETTLVNIKAIDAPALHLQHNMIGIDSEIRYGQGIIIDPAGIIATNRHIIDNALHIYVTLPGRKTFEAFVLHKAQTDLCLIKINAPFRLKAVSLANSSELQTGKNIIAIANTHLSAPRIKDGRIIQVFKAVSSNKVELLETNVTLKPGDSGGPILNTKGKLLGLIMAEKHSDPSKSYAVASSRIQQEYSNYENTHPN
jgi:S1-C subfamily serine protease